MKILHITTNFHPVIGGIETYVSEIAKRAAVNNEVYIVTGNRNIFSNKKLPDYEIKNNVKIFRFPFRHFLRYTFSIKALKFILSRNWDIIHIHNVGMFLDLISLLKTKTKKIFFHTHGGIFHTNKLKLGKIIYFNTLMRFNLKFVTKTIAHSIHDMKMFQKISKNINLINYGIDSNYIKKTSNGKTLIYTGRLSSNKRIDRLIFILDLIRKEIPDIKLNLIGSDWGEKKNLINISKKLGVVDNINFIDYVPHEQIIKHLSRADIFLLPSDYEGFGISVIEAMAAGVVPVVNDIPSMQEILNPKTGFICNFENFEETAEVILKLLKNKKLLKKISTNDINAVKKYDWNIVSKKLFDEY